MPRNLADEIEETLVRCWGFRPGRSEYRSGLFAGDMAKILADAIRAQFEVKPKRQE